jgi:transposase InsO family protein
MDGRGRALDNVFIEQFWRSVKYEEVYLNDYQTIPQAIARLKRYFRYYNSERPHQSLDYQTPESVHRMGSAVAFYTEAVNGLRPPPAAPLTASSLRLSSG